MRKYLLGTLAGVLLGGIPAPGQSIQASSGSGVAGKNLDIAVSIADAAGVSAVRWETTFPAQLLEIAHPPETGQAASVSGKSLTCAQPKAYVYVCIVAGGRKSIRSGPIAVFHFKVRADARRGTAIIRLDKVDAVTAKLEAVPLDRVDGEIDFQ